LRERKLLTFERETAAERLSRLSETDQWIHFAVGSGENGSSEVREVGARVTDSSSSLNRVLRCPSSRNERRIRRKRLGGFHETSLLLVLGLHLGQPRASQGGEARGGEWK